MSLNKFCDIGVKKEWMNINCNKIDCNELDATTLDIGSLNVLNINTQSLSVVNGASIGDLTVLRTLTTEELKVDDITYTGKTSLPRVKTLLSIPTNVATVQQVVSPYVAYTDDPVVKNIISSQVILLPNAGGLSPQSSLTLALEEGDCYEFIAYLKNGATEITTPTTFYVFLDDDIPLNNTFFAISRIGANSAIKFSCKFSITDAGTPTSTVFSAFECLYSYAGSPTPTETALSTYYFNTGVLPNPSNFTFAMSNLLTPFAITLQSASLNCVYSSNVSLAV
jgi:hypothetical protein